MATRTRPAGCCPPRAIDPIPSGEKERLAALFHALADPNRLQILRPVAAPAGAEGGVWVFHPPDHTGLALRGGAGDPGATRLASAIGAATFEPGLSDEP